MARAHSLRDAGLVRSIGVSNFTAAQIDRLIEATGVAPAINQIELHPRFQQAAMVDFDADLGIVTEAWSPLGRGSDVIGDPVIAAIASAHRRTPAQVVLRWHVQRGVVPIPKSSNPSRMAENLAVFDLELSSAEMARIAALNGGRRLGGDPDRHAEL